MLTNSRALLVLGLRCHSCTHPGHEEECDDRDLPGLGGGDGVVHELVLQTR